MAHAQKNAWGNSRGLINPPKIVSRIIANYSPNHHAEGAQLQLDWENQAVTWSLILTSAVTNERPEQNGTQTGPAHNLTILMRSLASEQTMSLLSTY